MAKNQFDFHEIHEAYRGRVTRYLARLAGEAEAEDLCQEVFSKIDRSLENFRGESELSTWIYRVATNTFNDHLRGRSGNRQRVETLTSHDLLEELPVDASVDMPSGSDQQVIREEMIDCVRGYIEQLPDDYRIVLLLSEEEGFKNREIADILQVSLDNVKVRLHRARARLKGNLKDNCDFYLDERGEIACDRKQDCN